MGSNEGKGIPEVRLVIPIPCNKKFFRTWVEVLEPVHGLTDREMDLLSAFIKRRHELQKSNMSQDQIDAVLMSSSIKKEIRSSVGISTAYYQRIVRKFRDKGILIPDPAHDGERINPRYIPDLREEDKSIGALFIFMNPNDC